MGKTRAMLYGVLASLRAPIGHSAWRIMQDARKREPSLSLSDVYPPLQDVANAVFELKQKEAQNRRRLSAAMQMLAGDHGHGGGYIESRMNELEPGCWDEDDDGWPGPGEGRTDARR